jgi:hypothetical protein
MIQLHMYVFRIRNTDQLMIACIHTYIHTCADSIYKLNVSCRTGAFLITLLAGTLPSSLAIIPLVIDDNVLSAEMADLACMATPWLYSIGFVLTFAALFAKTYRISRIFNNKKVRQCDDYLDNFEYNRTMCLSIRSK